MPDQVPQMERVGKEVDAKAQRVSHSSYQEGNHLFKAKKGGLISESSVEQG